MTESTGSVELAVDHDHGDLGGEQRRDVALRAVRGHDHAGGLLADGERDVAGLLVLVLVGVAQDDGELAGEGGVLDAASDGREEGVLDVGDDQQPQARALAAQVAGEVVGPVAELQGSRPHPGGELRVDGLVVVERPGHRGHGDLRLRARRRPTSPSFCVSPATRCRSVRELGPRVSHMWLTRGGGIRRGQARPPRLTSPHTWTVTPRASNRAALTVAARSAASASGA